MTKAQKSNWTMAGIGAAILLAGWAAWYFFIKEDEPTPESQEQKTPVFNPDMNVNDSAKGDPNLKMQAMVRPSHNVPVGGGPSTARMDPIDRAVRACVFRHWFNERKVQACIDAI